MACQSIDPPPQVQEDKFREWKDTGKLDGHALDIREKETEQKRSSKDLMIRDKSVESDSGSAACRWLCTWSASSSVLLKGSCISSDFNSRGMSIRQSELHKGYIGATLPRSAERLGMLIMTTLTFRRFKNTATNLLKIKNEDVVSVAFNFYTPQSSKHHYTASPACRRMNAVVTSGWLRKGEWPAEHLSVAIVPAIPSWTWIGIA